MKKQLFMKAFRAILALVLFVGAVTVSSAQALPNSKNALQMLHAKMEQIGNKRPIVHLTQNTTLTPAQALATYRYGFYKQVGHKIRTGLTVEAAIDDAYTTLAHRNQTAANTLRQEVVSYLTKS